MALVRVSLVRLRGTAELAARVILIALLAPLVSYRRRDALTMLVPPSGIRVAWRAGTRLAQLPRRDWPALSDEIMLSGRWRGGSRLRWESTRPGGCRASNQQTK
jgi:hypothetical protein